MKQAIGYVRVSTTKQANEGESLDAQRKKIIAWAALHDMQLLEIYSDEGISGKSLDKRTGFADAVNVARDGVTLVVYSISRFARSTEDLLSTVKTIRKQGGSFASIVESFDISNHLGKFFMTILGAIAELEAETIKERCSLGRAEHKAKGLRVGEMPYGQTVAEDGETLVESTTEKAIIETVHSLKASGLSLRKIAAELAARGYTTRRGGQWTAQGIAQSILKTAA